MKATVKIDGLAEIRKKIRAEGLLADPLRKGFEKAGQVVQEEARKSAPVASGNLREKIKLTISSAAIPKWAKVTANASRKRFRYGYALNASDRYHYRGSRRATKDWFWNVRARVSSRVNRIMQDVGNQIGEKWRT